jgi:N-acetylglutamate synthase-like GNAT family acetyltransferase
MTRPLSPGLRAQFLRSNERGALAKALAKSGLPVDDLEEPGRLFFRFDRADDVPVGFGGLQIFGQDDALLRLVIVLPPLRKQGFGAAIVAALEQEAALHKFKTIWLLTSGAAKYFERLGYSSCPSADMPSAIRSSKQFAALCADDATAMVKQIG